MVLFDNENKNAALNEESPSFSQQSTAEQSAPEHSRDNGDLAQNAEGPKTLDVVVDSPANPNTPDAGEGTAREAEPPATTEQTISDPEFHSELRGTATPTEISTETPGTEIPVAAEQQQPESTPKTEKPVAEDFASILESFETEQQEAAAAMEDRVIRGTVVSVTEKYLVVDIGAKSEGMVPIDEVKDHEGNVTVKPGDEIDVMREKGETEDGYPKLSYQKAQRLRAWDEIEKAYNDKTPIKAIVIDRIKGGLTVDIAGARAFLPGSQVDLRPVRNLDGMKGQELEVRVIKLNKKRGNIVVSRKQMLEEEVGEKRQKTLEQLSEGAILTGVVKNLTDYGAFVDMGGIDGLLHITDMSWGRLTHPRDLVQVGDHIQVKVLKFDKDKARVSLGFKQLTPDPWLDATERYPIGAHVRGRVISVTDYGAFIELEQGIEGLVHVSEMTWSKRMKHPSKIVNVGDEVEAVVLNVNPTERRISLGLKQLQMNPWESLHEKFPIGSTVEGRVRNLTDFGAFIEIEDGIDGLVHVSNLSWTKRVKHPSEVLKKGDRVKAQVLAIEPDNRRLSLGIKQLEPDVWETFFQQHRIGDVVHGKVLRVASFGAFVEVADGVEGLCHNSEAVDEHGQPMPLEPGNEYEFKIIKMNPAEKKVGLSIRAVGEEASRADVESYKHASDGSSATLGELMSWKRERD
ncbi:MAG TPA: 30S ribosomal protein S1 [Terriglobales bacterium]|nr:30S ribosomal protein S1 [Terriglobales bacterium]